MPDGPSARQRGGPDLHRGPVGHGAEVGPTGSSFREVGDGHHPDDEVADTRHWMVRGFITVVVAVGPIGALAVWLWLRPLRDGAVQAVLLWLGCASFVGAMALVWWPHGDADHPYRHHRWLLAGLIAISLIMAAFGLVVAREDRRPGLRHLVAVAVAGQPLAFERETTWAYQPRYVGGLGSSDWSVCRTFVVTGDPNAVAQHVATELAAAGVGVGPVALGGDASSSHGEVRVEGDQSDRLVVCVEEVDPSRH